jgi:hypothetical protein
VAIEGGRFAGVEAQRHCSSPEITVVGRQERERERERRMVKPMEALPRSDLSRGGSSTEAKLGGENFVERVLEVWKLRERGRWSCGVSRGCGPLLY